MDAWLGKAGYPEIGYEDYKDYELEEWEEKVVNPEKYVETRWDDDEEHVSPENAEEDNGEFDGETLGEQLGDDINCPSNDVNKLYHWGGEEEGVWEAKPGEEGVWEEKPGEEGVWEEKPGEGEVNEGSPDEEVYDYENDAVSQEGEGEDSYAEW